MKNFPRFLPFLDTNICWLDPAGMPRHFLDRLWLTFTTEERRWSS
jgi:hypothetical protein